MQFHLYFTPQGVNVIKIDSIKIIITIVTITTSVIGIIIKFRDWGILSSIFCKHKFRFKFYRFIKYKLARHEPYILDSKESIYEFKS